MPLFINIDPNTDTHWRKHPTYSKATKNGDVGLDIPMLHPVIVPPNAISFKINLGFKARPSHGYMLFPRSSISKTGIRLANSVGVIDKNYRGDVMVVVDNIKDEEVVLSEGMCYFQIVAFDGVLPRYQIDKVDVDTSRGEGGFGSTGAS